MKVTKIHGTTMLVGSVLSCIILKDIIVVGTNVTPQVLITKKVIILRLAVSFSLFIFCKDSMAFNPNGVAAFPRPNRLAIIFEEINPIDSCPFGISGNNLESSGEMNFDSLSNRPDCLAMFIIPSHRANKGKI